MGIKSLADKMSIKNLRLRDKILLGFVISSVLPLLILVYLFLNVMTPETYQLVKGLEFVKVELIVPLIIGLSILGVTISLNIADSIKGLLKKTEDFYPHIEYGQDQETDEIVQLSRSFSLIADKIQEQMSLVSEFKEDMENAREQLRASRVQLKEMASRDELTGLFNRRFFNHRLMEELKRARRYGHPLCVILVDIDDFKIVNDRFGHSTGDRVLKEFAGVLRDGFREVDIIARYGGEEFGIILPETKIRAAREAAERARRRIEKQIFLKENGDVKLRMTMSVGVFSCDPMKDDLEDILRKADRALYMAKKQGRNRVVHYTDDDLSPSTA